MPGPAGTTVPQTNHPTKVRKCTPREHEALALLHVVGSAPPRCSPLRPRLQPIRCGRPWPTGGAACPSWGREAAKAICAAQARWLSSSKSFSRSLETLKGPSAFVFHAGRGAGAGMGRETGRAADIWGHPWPTSWLGDLFVGGHR